MSRPALVRALDHIRATAGRPTPLDDNDLLTRFAADRDEAAFAELVRRHGPLVRGVARRRLADAHEADDVAQATFLALARQAGRVNDGRPLAGWLFTVAHRLACKAQVRAARRPGPPQDDIAATSDPLAALTARELVAALDDELARLPERYRLPLVLCALEGLSRDEAAVRLGWTLGSFRGRLERGRELLRKRLSARGLTVPAVLAGGLLATPAEAMPAALVRAVVRAAIAMPPAAMPVKLLVAAAVVLTALGVGTGVALMPGGQPTPKANPPAPMAVGQVVPQPRVDAEGVPLPPGVLARFGSSRMRHAGMVFAVALSPDGKSVASADMGTVRLWDAATGKPLQRWDIRTDSFPALGFTADGRQLLCVAKESKVFLRSLNPVSGQELRRVELRGGKSVDRVAIAKGGQLVALSWDYDKDRSVRLYETATGKETVKIPFDGRRVMGMTFSADDRTIAVADLRDTLNLYDTATGRVAGELKQDGLSFNLVGLSPDGRSAVTMATHDRGMVQLQFWDLPEGKMRNRVDNPAGYPQVLAISPDSRLALSASGGGPCLIWDVATGTEVRRFSGFRGGFAAAVSANGRMCVVGGNSGTVTLWDVETGNLRPASANPPIGPWGLEFSADGRHLFGVGVQPWAWEVGTGGLVPRFSELPMPVNNIALSHDEKLVAISARGVRLYDAVTGREVRALKAEKFYPDRLEFTRDGRRLVGSDTTAEPARIFDVATGAELFKLPGHGAWVRDMAVSPDGRSLATAEEQQVIDAQTSVYLWDLTTGRELRKLDPRGGTTSGLAFSPDGERLVVLSRTAVPTPTPSELQVFDVRSGREVRSGKVPSSGCVAFSPDGRTLALPGGDGTLLFWEVGAGGERHRFAGHVGGIFSIAFSPEGRTVASASNDAPVYLWDIYGRSDPQQPLNADDLKQCWTDLAATDAAIAFRSIRRLIGAPEAAIAQFRDRLKPTPPPDAERVKQIIVQLDSPKFADRQAAAKELDAVADRASDQLRAALSETKSAEVRQALQKALDRLETGSPETLRALRSVEVLEQVATPAAREQLKSLAGGTPGATLSRAAAEALKRMEKKPGEPGA